MSLTIRTALTGPLPGEVAKAEIAAAGAALAGEFRNTGTLVKNAFRRQVKRAGLGKLELAVRMEAKPAKGPSLDPRVRIFSKALAKRKSGIVDILEAFDSGVTLPGGWYAIATDRAGRDGRGRATPKTYGTFLKLVPFGPRLAALVPREERRPPYAVYFWVVPGPITLRKRTDFARDFARLMAGLPERLAKRWDREATKRGVR